MKIIRKGRIKVDDQFAWGALASAIPAVASMFGGKKSSGGGGGTVGGGVVTFPEYSFTEPRLKLTSDFLTQQLDNLMKGEAPPYLQAALPGIESDLRTKLRKTYYGRPGERTGSVMNAGYETAAALGIGPKAAIAQSRKSQKDYAEKASEIDRYIEQIQLDAMNQVATSVPQYSMQMPVGPRSQYVAPTVIPGEPTEPDYFSQAMGALGGLDWGSIFPAAAASRKPYSGGWQL